MQAEVNIGMVGHVDHGKTSLTRALTGKWTDTHSEELKRGISIKIGYADISFYKCPACKDHPYSPDAKCKRCGEKGELIRRVSFLDAPGHETLMTTTIAASSILDGAVLVVAANEECPQPQTYEHLMVLNILGIRNIVVVQNKIDLVSPEKAKANYLQIRNFLKGTVAENAPIIPVAAHYGTNIDALIEAIETYIPTPKREMEAPSKIYIARSFDVNKPGAEIAKLKGGVVGGSLIRGKIKVGDELEIGPGVIRKLGEKKEECIPLKIKVHGLHAGGEEVNEVHCGGLIAIATGLDSAITKNDGVVGNILAVPGTLPPVSSEIKGEFEQLKRPDLDMAPIKPDEVLVISVGTATSIGIVLKVKGNELQIKLKRPICLDTESRVALSRRIGQRWRLAGFGKLKVEKEKEKKKHA